MQSMLRRNKKTLTSRPLGCESLEDRRVLATMVGTEADLRAALEGPTPADCVVLTADITLTTGQIFIEADSAAGGIEIDGAGFTVTGTGTDRVFGIDDGDMTPNSFTVTFKDITITGGGGVSFGGGVASQETLVFEDATVTGNRAIDTNTNYTHTGGGIDAAGDLTLTRTTVSNNTASGDAPGYLEGVGGGVNVDGAVKIYDSYINGNDASNRGGGIAINGIGPHIISGSTFDNNVIGNMSYFTRGGVSTAGGGVYVDAGAGYAGLDLTIDSSSISGNVAGSDASDGTSFDYGSGLDVTTRGTGDIVNLDNLTIQNNSSSTDAISFGYLAVQRGVGAALTAVEGGTFNLSNSLISGNEMSVLGDFPGYGGGLSTSTLDGGAGFAYPGYFNISDTDIVNNTALRGGGFASRYQGGYYNDGVGTQSVVNITGGSVSNNTANGDGGGATWNWVANDLTLEGVTMDGNYDYGGGGAISNLKAFSGNPLSADLMVNNSTISNNYSLSTGGGLQLTTSGLTYAGIYPNDVTVSNSTISGNRALANGGGFYVYDSDLILLNSTVSGNYSPGVGGGANLVIACDTTGGGGPCYTGTNKEAIFEVDQVTFYGNYSAGGATLDVAANSSVAVSNTLFTDNMPQAGGNLDDFVTGANTYGAVISVDYSLVEFDTSGNAYIAGGSGNITGVNGNVGALADNGGPTMTHALISGSPAIDSADPAGTGTDQRGYATGGDPNGVRDDIGAFEFGAEDVPPPGGCDFDMDGDCDIDDLDMLTMDIAAGSNTVIPFDLNMDGVVNLDDVTDPNGWLALAGAEPSNVPVTGGNPYLQGDFNLDGVVDGQDFVIWNANKFTNTGGKWSLGDANADGVTDGQDFVVWNANKFTSSNPIMDNAPQTEVGADVGRGNMNGRAMREAPGSTTAIHESRMRTARPSIGSSSNSASLENGFVADAALDSTLAEKKEVAGQTVAETKIVRAPGLATRVFASDSSIRENASEVEAVDSVFEKLGL